MIYYLATPFSKFKDGPEEAYRRACINAAACLREGILVFSPISHGYGIHHFAGFGGDYKTWKLFCEKTLELCRGIIVVKMPGWEESEGIKEEIKFCEIVGRPIIYRDDASA